jgi:DNA gyrase subunit A
VGAEEAEGEGEAAAGSGTFVFAATRRGIVKKTPLEEYARPRANGIIALSIEEGDSLIAARITDGRSHILLSTAQGIAIRFEESDVRSMGRGAYGVKGIALAEGDEVVSAESLPPVAEGAATFTILSVTANGYGKRSELTEYRTQTRAGKGIITIKATERNGPVVAAMPVVDADEVMLITNRGMLIRMKAAQISLIGRNTQGVRLISVESREEQVAGVARVAENVVVAGEPVEGTEPPPGEGGVGDDQGSPGGEPA